MNVLLEYINNPKNDNAILALADYYYDIDAFAPASSFYLKCAEFSTNKETIYHSLLKLYECYKNIGNRDFTCEYILKLATSIIIDRPEAYIYLCEYYYHKKDYINLLLFTNLSLEHLDKLKCIKYPEYLLLLYKGTACWYLGKIVESRYLFETIKNKYYEILSEEFKKIIDNNIEWTQNG